MPAPSPDWRNTEPRLRDIPAAEIYQGSHGVLGGDPKATITLPCVTRVDYPASRDPVTMMQHNKPLRGQG